MIPAFTQEKEAEKQEAPVEVRKIDTVKVNYMPTGIRLGTDLLSIIMSQVDEKFNGWEVNADVDFYRYYFAVDYGYLLNPPRFLIPQQNAPNAIFQVRQNQIHFRFAQAF